MIKSNGIIPGIFACLAIAFIAACNGSSGSATASRPLTKTGRSESRDNKTQPQSPIRQLDFKNFTYPKLPTGKCSMAKVSLVNGNYEARAGVKGKRPAVDCWSVALGPITYGDVTGDGQEEAMVELYAELGGTEAAEDVYIYTLQGGKPVLLWKFATGDRADGGLRRIAAENGELLVELFGVGTAIGKKLYGTEDAGACCPRHFTRTRYKWVGTKFQQVGPAQVFENPNESSAPVRSESPPAS